MLVTARVSRCSDWKSKMDACGSTEPGRGVYCTKDIPPPLDDLEVGAQGASTLEVLQNGQQVLRSRTQRIQRAYHVRQIRAGIHPLQRTLLRTYFYVGGGRDNGLAAAKRRGGLVHFRTAADHHGQAAVGDGCFFNSDRAVHDDGPGTGVDDYLGSRGRQAHIGILHLGEKSRLS